MDLVALEEIRRLKYRYLRCVDLKLWDEFAAVFTEDAVAEYDAPVLNKVLRLEGRDAIVDYMRSNLGPDKTSTHTAGCPEIDIDGDRATGVWSLDDTIILHEHNLLIRGAAFYHDTYRRQADGTWLVEQTGHRRTYEYTVSLDDAPSLKFTTSH
ncbi:nuclear transport factor 2 family protein [Actinomadura darangshiensis]|uniref:Nuclear transport factor 2 family protein n=1 Tax=Actinomadura darangshiensis TaxID=705336 RepID=A0A4R5B4V4_9ACTN|nr:nuclear transport factor 2 family protein [Actinomadura darangshiensis]TDD80881.1 nuclear transport factor 2 family protein [Actinomadura darangshiensis]